jgi:ferredoxin, 2Fe-2S
MAGTNPYSKTADAPPPKTPYELTFLPMKVTVTVDPSALPLSGEGLPGSILDIALGHGVELDHACGGVGACSTCHVIVRQGRGSCPEASEEEEDMLDTAPGLELDSRLGCQAVPDGSQNVVVEIPAWNRNHASESH